MMPKIDHILLGWEITVVQVQTESIVVFQQLHDRCEIGNIPPLFCIRLNLRLDSGNCTVKVPKEHAFISSFQCGQKPPRGVSLTSKQKRAERTLVRWHERRLLSGD